VVTPPPDVSGNKCAVGAVSGCTTVRYQVSVTGAVAGGDSSVTIDSLSDIQIPGASDVPFGDITTVHNASTGVAAVTGTTCGVADGTGSLSGTTGAGALPKSLGTSGTYTCQFDGTICSAPGTHTNQIVAGFTGHPSGKTSTFPTDPTNTQNGPSSGRVTIGVNDISGSLGNICQTN
jgi:hypothetical protein